MDKPNFVFILTDTQATNVIGAYGHSELQTPCIDRLAEKGVKFDRAYTTCPVCTPARAGIFTGIYPHSTGAWTNLLSLHDNIKTMGQRFRDAGYRTPHIGKWHLSGHDYFDTGVCPNGWEDKYWYDGKRYMDELTPEEIQLWRTGLNSVEKLREHNVEPEFTWAHRVSNRAIDFLANDQTGPFLMVVSYDEPHHPFTCPPEYAERFVDYRYPLGAGADDDLSTKPDHQREWAGRTGGHPENGEICSPLYFGCNSFVDAEIGRVVEAVEKHAPKNTYIIFTSDHGELMHAHRLTSKGPVMYEEITHIPFIFYTPGGELRPGAVSTPASHVDLLPTMCSLAGMEVWPFFEGGDLTPFLKDRREDAERPVFMEFNRYEIDHDSWGGLQPVRSVVQGDFKLVINLLYTDELYNLKTDRAEVTNLIDDPSHHKTRSRMHDVLLDWMYDKRDPFRGPCWERRPWREERRLGWKGDTRFRPPDGYMPQTIDYDTGLPFTGVKKKPR